MDSGRRARGTLEQEVVAALAAAHEPMTPAQVRDHLGRDLAYTTVMTVLARLSDKGLVTREQVDQPTSPDDEDTLHPEDHVAVPAEAAVDAEAQQAGLGRRLLALAVIVALIVVIVVLVWWGLAR